MNPIEAITVNLYKLTKKEQAIAEFILNDPVSPIQLSSEEFVNQSGTSKAAFIRFCQKIGYNGYSEFRFALSRFLVGNIIETNSDDSVQSITNLYLNFIAQIPNMVKIGDVHDIAEKMISANRIKIFGYNRTALSARQLRLRMSKIGIDAEVVDDQVQMRDVCAYLNSTDIAIIFSIKASDNFYGANIRQMLSNNVPIVLITMNPKNKFSDDVTKMVTLPFISRASSTSFLDDQTIFFIFIELLLNELAKIAVL